MMIAHKDKVQGVKQMVNTLNAQGRTETQNHCEVYRPWGSYDSVDMGGRFQVKHISVKPGACLSLQMHHHRAEHWIVVSGTARSEERRSGKEGGSTDRTRWSASHKKKK